MQMKIKSEIINEIPVITYELDNNLVKPLIFFFHGFTGNKDNLMGRGEKLAEMGFYVVAIDADLHGERTPKWFNDLDNTIKYQYIIDIVIKTANDAKYLWENKYKKEVNIKNDKFYAYGVSMGAMTSFTLATITNELEAIVTLVGSPSYVDYYLDRQKKYKWENEIVETRLKKYQKLDPLKNYHLMKNVKIFIALGKNDEVVNPKYALEFYKNRKNNTILKTYGTGHVSTPEMLNDAYDYLNKCLKGR